MTSTSPTTNSVFQAFIEAQHALERLPALEAELVNIKTDADAAHHGWDEAELKAMSLEDELKAVKAELATREEALAAATFREQEVAHKLAVIQSVIGLPRPEPVVESHPVAQGQSDADPTQDASTTTQDSANATTQETVSPVSNAEASPAGTSGEASDANHTQNEGVSQSTNAGSTGASTDASSHERLPYWRKLAHTSWADWIAAGNEAAPWLHDDHTDPHSIT